MADYILPLFLTMNVEQLIAAEYSRKALKQQKHVSYHNWGVIDMLWEDVTVSPGSNSKYTKLYSTCLL